MIILKFLSFFKHLCRDARVRKGTMFFMQRSHNTAKFIEQLDNREERLHESTKKAIEYSKKLGIIYLLTHLSNLLNFEELSLYSHASTIQLFFKP